MQVNREWINISDMMAGLMMVFLFIAVLFMNEIQKKQQGVEKIADDYFDIQGQLNRDLNEEFEDDLPIWGAEILEDNTIRFNSPDILFDVDSTSIKPFFKKVLNNFFPRYLGILMNDVYRNEIHEVRVEGHTSSRWEGAKNDEEKYLNNIELSQGRARTVLEYSYEIKTLHERRRWLENVFRANGMAFAKTIQNFDGTENELASQRVEFRVLTRAEEKLRKIFEELKTLNQ